MGCAVQKFTNVTEIMDAERQYDWSLFQHSLNCARLMEKLARDVGYGENDIKEFKVGALIHDVGKIQIPQKVLLKKGRLTDDEFKIVKQHPLLGYKLLDTECFTYRQLQIILYHHERCDMSGYPFGLDKERLPECAQLMAIVDMYEALLSKRTYKPAYPPEAVLPRTHW